MARRSNLPVYSSDKILSCALFFSLLSLIILSTASNALALVPSDKSEREQLKRSPQQTNSFQDDASIAPVFTRQKVRKEAIVPQGNSEIITDIVVLYVDRQGNKVTGKTKPHIITQEFALRSGDVYQSDLAKEGLQRVLNLAIIDRASLSLQSVGNRAVMIIAVRESGNLPLGFGLTLPPPTALRGPVRPTVINAISDSGGGISGGIRLGLLNLDGSNQEISLGVEGGVKKFGFNLGYRKFLRHDRGIGINFFNSRNIEPEFVEGDRNVNLESDRDPWVHRLGGGIEYFRSIGILEAALGASYQRVSIRDNAFSSDLELRDELGNRLTGSDDGRDDLLTISFSAVLDREDNLQNPTRGYKLQFGSDQYIPIGEASVLANRVAINYTQYIPAPLFGFGEGAKTLVLNFQGGTILGDALPYEAFSLGGSSSVRGYGDSEIATARSFVQTTAEYRYPIAEFSIFKIKIDLGGAFFVDYATDLGSSDAVIGQPAVARDKPGDGFGYGLGLRALTPVGAVRTEFALNDEGDTKFIFKIGDRF